MSHKLILSAAILAALAAPAAAADAVADIAPAPEAQAAEAFTWTGGYLGVQGGGGWLDGKFSVPGDSISEDFNGGLISGFVGYNYQFGDWVIGAEGDLTYNWNDNKYDIFGTDVKVGTDLAGSVRARAGYAFDNALIYTTAGWTATSGYVEVPGIGDVDRTFSGYTVGAGVDYAFTNNIFARAEYRFNDFGSKTIEGVKVDLDQHQVTFGIGVKF